MPERGEFCQKMGATMIDRSRAPLELFKAPTPLKLAALWASLMFCYVYGDYFGLYVPGKLAEVAAGRMGFGTLTPGKLALVAIMMAVPGLMIALSLLLPPGLSRALNLLFGIAYTVIMLLTMSGGAPPFYLTLGTIEVVLTLTIVAYAWTWPRRKGSLANVDA